MCRTVHAVHVDISIAPEKQIFALVSMFIIFNFRQPCRAALQWLSITAPFLSPLIAHRDWYLLMIMVTVSPFLTLMLTVDRRNMSQSTSSHVIALTTQKHKQLDPHKGHWILHSTWILYYNVLENNQEADLDFSLTFWNVWSLLLSL